MISSWFERGGLGQILAPDEKAKSASEQDEQREFGFWQIVAPPAESHNPVAPPASAFLSPVPSSSDEVQCVNCHKWTPVAPSTPSPRGIMTTAENPSNHTPSALDCLVLSAAKETAQSTISPPPVADARNKVFRMCASSKPLTDKNAKKLQRWLTNDPKLAHARASHLGNLVPNGYTPLMAAAAVNHVVAAKIVLDVAPESAKEVDLEGKTALHIAAELGAVEMVNLLESMYPEGPDAPVDLTGHTPLGRAITSQHKAAKQNQMQLQQKLFSPGDVSVCGKPTPLKTRSSQLDLQIMYGYADMPGFRVTMEDAISCHAWPGYALLGVCDGHGDNGCVSEFVSQRVAPILQERLLSSPDDDISNILTATCLDLDAELKETSRKGGSTAVWALISETNVVVANVGDSRCILVQKANLEQQMKELSLKEEEGQPNERGADDNNEEERDAPNNAHEHPPVRAEKANSYVITALSEDHKPNLELEKARIEKAGLSVFAETFMDNGVECTIHKVQRSDTDRLAVSRAFGDFEYKANTELAANEQAVVAVPEIQSHARDADRDMYLVLACDGIWDVLSNQEVGDFVVKHVQEAIDAEKEDILPQVGDLLVKECLERGSTDNMTCMIVALAPENLGLASVIKGKTLDF